MVRRVGKFIAELVGEVAFEGFVFVVGLAVLWGGLKLLGVPWPIDRIMAADESIPLFGSVIWVIGFAVVAALAISVGWLLHLARTKRRTQDSEASHES
ncbi:hypothetical protein ACFFMN_28970 [Planobispora siamensis]|uniref:Uncharacterized protein n=1 Tax=Planobispora siamensis TaxID=936338 RepID=A0A8J3SEV7_9ACTN|nr:hypothetical protein [Planobispora siamensis]GIH91785.1 hypothetical protein Psi01_24150 [Planobispora siamensis]